MQQKAFVKLMVLYRKGTDNSAADALSRLPTDHLLNISLCRPRWVEIIVEGYEQDDKAKKLLAEPAVSTPNSQVYSLHQGLICYKDRVWLRNNVEAHKAILMSLHDSGVGGHSGFLPRYLPTYQIIVCLA